MDSKNYRGNKLKSWEWGHSRNGWLPPFKLRIFKMNWSYSYKENHKQFQQNNAWNWFNQYYRYTRITEKLYLQWARLKLKLLPSKVRNERNFIHWVDILTKLGKMIVYHALCIYGTEHLWNFSNKRQKSISFFTAFTTFKSRSDFKEHRSIFERFGSEIFVSLIQQLSINGIY